MTSINLEYFCVITLTLDLLFPFQILILVHFYSVVYTVLQLTLLCCSALLNSGIECYDQIWVLKLSNQGDRYIITCPYDCRSLVKCSWRKKLTSWQQQHLGKIINFEDMIRGIYEI